MSVRVYEIGDVWDLSIDVYNAATPPALVNATAATLTITGPDGAVLYGPTVIAPSSTGHYPHTRVLAASGRHRAVWAITGASTTDARTFTIDVRTAPPATDPTAQDIANVIPRYTLGDNTSGGAMRGTFDTTTVPSGEIAEQIGAVWANRVLVAIGGKIPAPTTGDLGRHIAALRLTAATGAAYQIISTYHPQEVDLVNQLLASYKLGVDALKASVPVLVA